MGTNKEGDFEQASQKTQEEVGSFEKDLPADHQQDLPEDSDLLNTYKWHTGAKQHSDGVKGEGGAVTASERAEKSTPTKWSKMQSWRKALSEDAGEKSSTRAEGSKQEKPASGRKNPFRRALSEPPGSLLSTSLAPTSSTPSPSVSPTDPLGSASQENQQRGGGALFRKYLRTVSQKFKKPRLQSRNSTPICQDEVGGNEPAGAALEPERYSWVPPQDVPVWDISSCVLQDGQILISREDEPMMRPRNRASSSMSNLSLQNLAGSHSNLECSPDHSTNTGLKIKRPDGGVRALIKRRFQGTAMRNSNTQINAIGMSSGGRHGSRESLLIPVSAAESLDLSSDHSAIIRPVHSSILGEKYCFEVINSESNHCFGCSSAAERDRWIEELRRTAQPNKDNCERTEHSLSLWVNEAKDLPPKRRYYCELHLDGTLFARTSSRAIGKSPNRSSLAGDGGQGASSGGLGGGGSGGGGGCQLFWGELLELDNLPPVSQLTLHLFRDEDPKKKRHSKDDSFLHPLGSVSIPLADITGRAFQEKWHPIVPYKVSGPGGTRDQLGPQASIRVKARFQNLRVLPIEKYKEFAEFVTLNYMGMCSSLEPLLSVREKEELAGALVHVLQSIGKAMEFLIDLGSAEVQRCGDKEALIFRENTLATKAIDEYMKLVGQKYLIDTLGEFITRLYASPESCEVDPRKCPASELAGNQKHLKEGCEEVVQRITEMHSSFPVELNKIFSSWMEECEGRDRGEIGQRLISASLFLRFLCPAILSPSLFGLTQPYPDSHTLRTLTLTAKVIQNLANFTLFGEKEEYMLFMNDFLEQHWEKMRSFLQRVSTPDSELVMAHFEGYVDLPLRLAVLHSLLTDIISPMKQETIDQLHPLPSILNQISDSLGPNAPRITVSSFCTEQSKPTYVPPKDLSKYSPLHNSLVQLPLDSKGGEGKERRASGAKERKRVVRTQSVPDRIKHNQKRILKRQASNDILPMEDQEPEPNPPLDISGPTKPFSTKAPPAPVPWIKVNINKEPYQMKTEHEEFNILDKHEQELSELRLGVEQVTERELEMAKRLEDFIAQTQDQNAMLQAEVQELRNQLALREEQLASATFRLGVIEEEREEDERKLNVAVAAVERMNLLEERFADLLKDMHQLSGSHTGDHMNTQHPVPDTRPDISSN
ncbi:RAS protein activator like-3 isoform X1 [Megalops cyprinoides]|uniref:RAS protein activator like-3 isoform X1 n=1 Tax=Megalops cyprinoides TaxID=118141 RepID=UPI0018647403|nr:RAS protein activator like-3 isoform X1 [Megalops cyprinoides]